MIETRTDTDALSVRLTARAQALVKARIARRHTSRRWRDPRWLWPLFTGGSPWK